VVAIDQFAIGFHLGRPWLIASNHSGRALNILTGS
jgi:hypothetical protein